MHKRIQWLVAILLSLVSPVLFALGLGNATVDSYLDQPLDVRVALISRSEGELESITANLASADDFEMLGLSFSAITVPLEFTLVTDSGEPYLRITSELNISEPVMQILVEVVWSSGRMLREYTLFLDPPTFASAAPAAKPRSAPPPAPVETTQAPVQRTPAVAPAQLEPAQVAPEPEATTEDSTAAGTVTDEPATDEFEADDELLTDSSEADTESPEEMDDVTEDSQQDEISEESMDTGEVYGPVARGETLWGIAREWSQGTNYSINQTMIALQRKNPDAFSKDNINSLKAGAILRLPAYSEVAELTSRQAMLEVLRQEEEVRTGIQTVAPDYPMPTVADSGDFQATETEVIAQPEVDVDSGRLEIVPPVETEPEASADALQQAELETEPAQANESIQEDLLRSEEELVNAQQENTYLKQRIAELETAQQEQSLEVADSDLANLQESLARERAEDKPEPPVAVTPGGEQQPWYAGTTGWLLGIAIAVILSIIGVLRWRGKEQAESERAEEDKAAVQAVKEEAEDLLEILDNYEAGAVAKTTRANSVRTRSARLMP
jgi:pilus assembly protein FimV